MVMMKHFVNQQFARKVNSATCIDNKWKCDGDFDCPDHSNEKDCKERIFDEEGNLCSSTDFTCQSGDGCIHKTWECDGVKKLGS